MVFTEILLRMEDAGVLNGYDFQQQARLFWHADLGNLSIFLEDARALAIVPDPESLTSRGALSSAWKRREQLMSKYKKLADTPLFKIIEMNLMGNDGHP